MARRLSTIRKSRESREARWIVTRSFRVRFTCKVAKMDTWLIGTSSLRRESSRVAQIAEASAGECERIPQLDIVGSSANLNGKFARLGTPAFLRNVVKREGPPAEMQCHVFRFARLQVYSSETFEFFHRAGNTGVRVADIKLRHFRPFATPRVLDVKRNLNGLIEISGSRRERQVAVCKRCVREAKAKREKRLDTGTIKV